MRKILLIVGILLSTTIYLHAIEEQSLVVQSKTGSESVHTLSGVKKIIFSGTTMSVEKKDATQSDYILGDVKKLLFALRIINSTNNVKVPESNLKAYPNPSTNILFVEGINSEKNIRMFNLLGNEFNVSYILVGNILQVNTSRLPQGLYLLQINNQIIKFQKQ